MSRTSSHTNSADGWLRNHVHANVCKGFVRVRGTVPDQAKGLFQAGVWDRRLEGQRCRPDILCFESQPRPVKLKANVMQLGSH